MYRPKRGSRAGHNGGPTVHRRSAGADVVVIDPAGTRYPGTTRQRNRNPAGNRRWPVHGLRLHAGYLPPTGAAAVDNGDGASTVTPAPARSPPPRRGRRLTYDEIIAAGIDPNDPAAQNIVHFTVCLAFGNVTCRLSSPQITGHRRTAVVKNPSTARSVAAAASGGSCSATICSFTTGDGQHVDYSSDRRPGRARIPPRRDHRRARSSRSAKGSFIITPRQGPGG